MSNLNTNTEVQELLNLLRASFTEKDNVLRNEAEQKLKQYENNILEFIKLTTYVVLSEDLNNEQSLRLSVIVYLKNQLKTKLNHLNSHLRILEITSL